MKSLKCWFAAYVQTFVNGNESLRQNILLKSDHTMRVCREIVRLGKALALSSDALRLAEIMALFHDVGRFEQYVRYRTFADRQSEDHAKLGIQILEYEKVLNAFDDATQDLILRTIQYHNRAKLHQNETEQCLFFAKLLRDADKLDIWKVVTDYYYRKDKTRNVAIELDLPDTPGISPSVYQDIMDQRIVDANHIKNLNDFKALQAGWIFDVNFAPALRAVRLRCYLEMIWEGMSDYSEIREIFEAFIFIWIVDWTHEKMKLGCKIECFYE